MSDFFLAKRLMDQRVHEEHRQAELRRLAGEAQGVRAGWVSRLGCSLAWRVGTALVSFGRQLQAVDMTRRRSAAGEASAS